MQTQTPPAPAGWYDDPPRRGGHRYWDGHQWTGDLREPPRERPIEWRERKDRYRKARWEAGTFRCFFSPDCSSPRGETEVHHLFYGADVGQEADSRLELLCSYHHEQVGMWARRHGITHAGGENVEELEAFRAVAHADQAAAETFRRTPCGDRRRSARAR